MTMRISLVFAVLALLAIFSSGASAQEPKVITERIGGWTVRCGESWRQMLSDTVASKHRASESLVFVTRDWGVGYSSIWKIKFTERLTLDMKMTRADIADGSTYIKGFLYPFRYLSTAGPKDTDLRMGYIWNR